MSLSFVSLFLISWPLPFQDEGHHEGIVFMVAGDAFAVHMWGGSPIRTVNP